MFSWPQVGIMNYYKVTAAPHYIFLLDPEDSITTTPKILVPAQQPICCYHLQIPVTPYTLHTMNEKEKLMQNT